MNSLRHSLLVTVVLALSDNGFAQGSAFTYQGRMSTGGTPANGQYEMTFTLYNAVTNGAVVGTGQTVAPITVTNGLFMTQLDFGAAAFNGSPRWLEITVNLFGSDMIPTTLVPRQPITPTPYAIHAANAAGLMTFNNAPLDIKVNGQRALRLEPGIGTGAPNIIGGDRSNSVAVGVSGAFIGGGGLYSGSDDHHPNQVNANYGVVVGGYGNTVNDEAAFIGGGENNRIAAGAYGAFIGGGHLNHIESNSYESFIGGGRYGVIERESPWSVLSGGYENAIGSNSPMATIAGGFHNMVNRDASYSVIGGGNANRIESDSFHSAISGGASNVIEGHVERSIISGGEQNRISYYANATTIGGGMNNLIEGPTGGTTISGGWGNHIQDEASGATIAGGFNNFVANNAGSSFIGGGEYNHIGGGFSIITGGQYNRIQPLEAHYASIGGGEQNEIRSRDATIAGGHSNVIHSSAEASSIGGGTRNLIQTNAEWATIAGGGKNSVSGQSATVGGGQDNFAGGAAATVSGGFANNAAGDFSAVSGGGQNRANGEYAFIGGGEENEADGLNAIVAGGFGNRAEGATCTISGGWDNEARGYTGVISGGAQNEVDGLNPVIAGGFGNTAIGTNCTVGGGWGNEARGRSAVIPGGARNFASGGGSFAAGSAARAEHHGAFVWSDGEGWPPLQSFSSAAINEFSVRARGGVRLVTAIDTNGSTTAGVQLASGSGTWSSLSDRNAKENLQAADSRQILEKVAALPLATWNYKAQDKSIRHIGPMAQDFRAAFGLGENERTITTVDADGVALAAIQGLNRKVEEENRALRQALGGRDAEIAELRKGLAELRQMVAKR